VPSTDEVSTFSWVGQAINTTVTPL
jgi:hypothetical protein